MIIVCTFTAPLFMADSDKRKRMGTQSSIVTISINIAEK